MESLITLLETLFTDGDEKKRTEAEEKLNGASNISNK